MMVLDLDPSIQIELVEFEVSEFDGGELRDPI